MQGGLRVGERRAGSRNVDLRRQQQRVDVAHLDGEALHRGVQAAEVAAGGADPAEEFVNRLRRRSQRVQVEPHEEACQQLGGLPRVGGGARSERAQGCEQRFQQIRKLERQQLHQASRDIADELLQPARARQQSVYDRTVAA